MRWIGFVVLVVASALSGCGGGGAVPPNPGGGPAEPPNPDLAVLFVSGHTFPFDDDPSLSYLDESFGPWIVSDLEDAGYTVAEAYFVDHPTATDAGGYVDLVATLEAIRDEWVTGRPNPTRVIVIAHSHGGTWATAAIREVADVPIRMQVALDHSSYGWGTVGHDTHDGVMGGDPRDAYIINTSVSCPSDLGTWSDTTNVYDLEDVVFPNVQEAFEIQSGEPVVFLEPYDEKWNARIDGTLTGLSCYWSGTDHNEVRRIDGTTYPVVINWILGGLATD